MRTQYVVGENFRKSFDFTSDNVKMFASLAGDTSPMHHDEDFARNSRFGGLIVSGTHYSALMMGMVANFLTQRGSGLGLEFNFQFRKAVFANESVTANWSITSVQPSAKLGGDLVTLEGDLRIAPAWFALRQHPKVSFYLLTPSNTDQLSEFPCPAVSSLYGHQLTVQKRIQWR